MGTGAVYWARAAWLTTVGGLWPLSWSQLPLYPASPSPSRGESCYLPVSMEVVATGRGSVGVGTHAPASCRSPCGRAYRLTQEHWQPYVRKQTTISVPVSTPCRWAGGSWLGWGGAGGSCLSPPAPCVQFLHGQGQRELSVQAVQTTRVGLKDQRKGLFSVWQEVFQLPRAQR